MTKTNKAFLLALAVAAMWIWVVDSHAEFKSWAPINPQFTGGNPMNGQWLLSKGQATNEFADDKLEKMMNELTGRIDSLTSSISDNLDNLNLTLSMPTVLQYGANNTGVIGAGTDALGAPAAASAGAGSGSLGAFKPSLGLQ